MRKFNGKTNRSDKYQYRLLETTISPLIWNEYPANMDFFKQLNPFQYSEEYLELKDRLLIEVRNIINTQLTEIQAEIINAWLLDLTQVEVGKMVKRTQSSVFKSIFGTDLKYKGVVHKYGGSILKLQKLCKENKVIQDILAEIGNHIEEKS